MAFKQLKLYFDKELAQMLADKISVVNSKFPSKSFIAQATKGLDVLELKDRVEHMADALNEHLIGEYREKIKAIIGILGPENDKEEGMFKKFYWVMPLAKFVEKYGIDHLSESLAAIEEITKRNTGEYAIRPFIERYPDKAMNQMMTWAKSTNRHVRRLASEGARPRLPWASKLQGFIDDPSPLFPILEQLKDDESKYVQKSVANCINDILKDNPDKARGLINRWSVNASVQRAWIIRHAVRNLRKKGDKWAMQF